MRKLFKSIVCLIIIFLRWFASENQFQELVKTNQNHIKCCVVNNVYIDEFVLHSPTQAKFFVRSDHWHGQIYIAAQNPPQLTLGQYINIKGRPEKLATVSPAYQNYLKLKGAWSVINNAQIEPLNEYRPLLKKHLFLIKDKIDMYITERFSSETGGVLLGVLLGDTDYISHATKNNFRISGLSHLMAISGANMTLMAEIVFASTFFLALRWRIIFTIMILTLFTLLVGATAAVLRAYLMAIIAFLGLMLGRPYLAKRALLIVLSLVYFFNPFIVLYDIGFQLSTLATFGLLELSPLFKKCLHFISIPFLLENITITLSATIATTPLILFHFGSISLLSPLINIIFAPLLSFLFTGGYALVLLLWIPVLGDIFAFTAEAIISLMLKGIEFASSWANLFVLYFSPSLATVVLMYWLLYTIIKTYKQALEKFPG